MLQRTRQRTQRHWLGNHSLESDSIGFSFPWIWNGIPVKGDTVWMIRFSSCWRVGFSSPVRQPGDCAFGYVDPFPTQRLAFPCLFQPTWCHRIGGTPWPFAAALPSSRPLPTLERSSFLTGTTISWCFNTVQCNAIKGVESEWWSMLKWCDSATGCSWERTTSWINSTDTWFEGTAKWKKAWHLDTSAQFALSRCEHRNFRDYTGSELEFTREKQKEHGRDVGISRNANILVVILTI